MIIVNNRDKLEWKKNMTVKDVLNEMGDMYSLITVTVNDKFVPEDDYESFLIPGEAKINVFHLAHGG